MGCKKEALIHNLSHRLPPSTKRCLNLLVKKRWATNNRLGRIVGADQSFCLCGEGKEDIKNIFRMCKVVNGALAAMREVGFDTKLPKWESQESFLELGSKFLNQDEVLIRETEIEMIQNALASGDK
jgi:hypothetical protein